LLATVGATLGIGAGILMARGLIRAMDAVLRGQSVDVVAIPVDGLVRSLLVGIGVTLLAAAIPAWQASRISPLEALRVQGKTKEGWVVRNGWPLGAALTLLALGLIFWIPLRPLARYYLGQSAVFVLFAGTTLLIPITLGGWELLTRPVIARLYGAEGRLGSHNLSRAKMRATLTVAALMVGVAMIIGIQGMTAAFRADIQAWTSAYLGGDLYVYASLPMRADLGPRLEAMPEVAAATPIRYLEVEWQQAPGNPVILTFTGLDPTSYQRVNSFVFQDNPADPDQLVSQLAAGGALFVSSAVAERYEVAPGDQLALETRRGVRNFTVAAIVVDFYSQGMVVHGNWQDMRQYFGTNDVSFYFLKVADGISPAAAQDQIEATHGQRRHLIVDTNNVLREQVFRLTDQTFGLFDVLAYIAIIVAAFGVVNTLTMSVSERTREIGFLRSLGMTRGQIRRMILSEAAIIGLIGSCFGIGFGLFLSQVFLMAFQEMRGYQLSFVLPIRGIFISLIITLIVSQLASLWPAQRAARLNIIEAIQHK
jgi:putative ABC transport system permease protein